MPDVCSPGGKYRRFESATFALSLLDTPYIWNGKYIDRDHGLDCSGLVSMAHGQVGAVPVPLNIVDDSGKRIAEGGPLLRQVSLYRGWWNAEKMWNELKPLPSGLLVPRAGDVACYRSRGSKRSCDHVMLCLDDGRVVGASGGTSRCTTVEIARQLHAAVKVYDSHLYRNDFIGFRSGPFGD